MAKVTAMLWESGKGRTGKAEFKLRLPCGCGCDFRTNPGLKGYLIGNVSEQNGVTIPIFKTATLKALEAEFGKAQ